jgi:hypothetical protein
MSIVLYANITYVPKVKELVEKLGIRLTDNGNPLLVSPQWQSDDQLFDDNHRFNFYIPRESTRGIEVWRHGKALCVCFMPFSADSEVDLALRFLEACQHFGASLVFRGLDDSAIRFDSLRKNFPPEFNQLISRSSLRTLIHSVKGREDAAARLSGPITDFYFGSHLADILTAESDEGNRLTKLLEMMGTLQFWAVRNDFRGCTLPEFKFHWNGIRIAVIKPDIAYLVPKVAELQFRKGDKVRRVPRKDFVERFAKDLCQDQFQLLDEYQFKLCLSTEAFDQMLADVPAMQTQRTAFISHRGVQPMVGSF